MECRKSVAFRPGNLLNGLDAMVLLLTPETAKELIQHLEYSITTKEKGGSGREGEFYAAFTGEIIKLQEGEIIENTP